MASILVIGFGNTLRGDDGVGVLAVRALRDTGQFGPQVTFLEMEAALVNLLDHLDGVVRLVVVDSLQSPGGTPGQMRRMGLAELDAAGGQAVSTHQLGLHRVLDLAQTLGFSRAQEVTICALEIEPPPDFSDRLTTPTERRMPEFLDLVTTVIHRETAGGRADGNDEIDSNRTQVPAARDEDREHHHVAQARRHDRSGRGLFHL